MDALDEGGIVHVRRQWTKAGEFGPPKTKKSARRVPISTDMAARLDWHRRTSLYPQDADLVFPSRKGTPLFHRNVQRRAWAPARDAAKLPSTLRFHDLRHAFASIAHSRGVRIDILSDVMGHSNIGVTQEVYVHLYGRPEKEDAFRAAMFEVGL